MQGLAYNMDINEYHHSSALSRTAILDMARCPAYYYAMHLDENRPANIERAGQLEGNLAHTALLEPDEFDKRYIVEPSNAPKRPTDAQWKAKKSSPESEEAKTWWTEFTASAGDRRIITSDQRYTAMCQAESMRKVSGFFGDMTVADALKIGQTETSAFWVDHLTGVKCRCRPDLAVPLGNRKWLLLDVKTYNDASAKGFGRQIARKAYFIQDSWYSEGWAAATGEEVVAFAFIPVEDHWPFLSTWHRLGEESRHEGALQHRDMLDLYAQCVKSGRWPSYDGGVIDLPSYILTPQDVEISYAA